MILQGSDGAAAPSCTLANRVGRALWGLAWWLLFRPSPRPLHGWRRALLRAFGARVGRGAHIYPGVRIWAPWLLEVGDQVGVGDGARLYNMAPLRLGRRCVVSQGAHLCGGTHDIDSPNFQLVARPIEVGEQAWVCADAFVGPGVRIAPGCVVGARAVVTKSIDEPWTVWAGNPARRVRARRQRGAA